MSLVKQSQSLNLDGVRVSPEALPHLLQQDVGDLRLDLDLEPETSKEEELMEAGGNVNGEITIEVADGGTAQEEFSFTLPKVPGGDDQDDIDEPAEIIVEEPKEVEVSDDPRRWTVASFMTWLHNMMNNIPRHTGRDVVGCERAIAHLEYLKRECSKAARSDLRGELNIDLLEKARDSIEDGIESLQDRIEKIEASKRPGKKKKKAAEYDEQGFVKEAGQPRVYGVTITVPLLISSLARSCINGMVSAGHDIEDIYTKLAKEYELTKREKLELIQLLSDMNYPLRRDLGMPLDKPIDYTSTDNVNWAANYPA
ncbi:MAG TPA: hypothetical protein VM577_10000 [Anaerovoracaceae bacterium]|nr:hypothetical protein [Anaerovoracaceae bacterium]